MSGRDVLDAVVIEPEVPARSSVIWLHGLGADGHDFEPVVPYLGLGPDRGVRFVFPHAPRRAVTINMGLIMPAWYDVRSVDLGRDADESGVRESAGRVSDLIARENDRGVPSANIVLAGFSQGGAVAVHVGLRHPDRLAGILALSCYLVCGDSVEDEISEANRKTPIFQAHGTADPMVSVERGEALRSRLQELGYAVTWKSYPIGHQVSPEEIREIGAWLRDRLP